MSRMIKALFTTLAVFAVVIGVSINNSEKTFAQGDGGVVDAVIDDINPIDDVTGGIKDVGDAVGDIANGDILGAAGNLTCAAGNFLGAIPGVGTVADIATDKIDKCSNGIGSECEGVNIFVGWIVCPIVRAIDTFIVTFLDETVEDLFTINFETGEGLGDETEGSDTVNAMKTMWTNMRNITNALFIILFVVAIFGHVTGAIEAYTAKKIIPRIVIAAILTQLSWFISVELSAIFDDFGKGISELLENNLDVEDITLEKIIAGEDSVQGVAFVAFLGGVGGIILGVMTILPFLISAAFAVIIGLITLLVRKVFIILLVIISPIALTLWALPTTEKWARQWFTWYLRLLVMYPFIEVLITTGKVSAQVLSGAGTDGERNWVLVVSAAMAFLAPYALLPTALAIATSTIGNISGFMNDKASGLFDGAKNWSKTQHQGRRQIEKEKALISYGNSSSRAGKSWYAVTSGTAFSSHLREQRDDFVDKAKQEEQRRADALVEQLDVVRRDQWVAKRAQVRVRALVKDIDNKAGPNGANFDRLNEEEKSLYTALKENGGFNSLVQGKGHSKARAMAERLTTLSGQELEARGYEKLAQGYDDDLGEEEKEKHNKFREPDAGLVEYKDELMKASIGSTVDIDGRKVKVTEAMQQAAGNSILKLHMNRDDATRNMDDFLQKTRSDNKADQRSANRFLRENHHAIEQKAPQLFVGSKRAALTEISQAALLQLSPGGNNHMLGDSKDKDEMGNKKEPDLISKGNLDMYSSKLFSGISNAQMLGYVQRGNLDRYVKTAREVYGESSKELEQIRRMFKFESDAADAKVLGLSSYEDIKKAINDASDQGSFGGRLEKPKDLDEGTP